MKLNKLTKALAFGALASCFSMQAGAAAISFDYTQLSGFTADNNLVGDINGSTGNIEWYGAVSDITGPPALSAPSSDNALDVFHTIAWGNDPISRGLAASDPMGNDDRSALNVVGATGAVSTGDNINMWGDWVTLATVQHQNNAIDGTAETLLSAIIRSTLYLVDGGLGAIALQDTNNVGVSFDETKNKAVECAGNPGGNPEGSVCDDLFGFSFSAFAPIMYSYGGNTFEVEFGFDPFSFINASTDFPLCDTLPGQCTLWTAEGVTSAASTMFRIRAVPEPATLLLLAAGLLGVGATMRRKQK